VIIAALAKSSAASATHRPCARISAGSSLATKSTTVANASRSASPQVTWPSLSPCPGSSKLATPKLTRALLDDVGHLREPFEVRHPNGLVAITRQVEAEIVGEMVLVPAAGLTHRYVQVQVIFNSVNEATGESFEGTPSLQQLRLTFIDTTGGPTADELIDLQQQMDEQQGVLPESVDGYPKPFVVSRDVWCTHADCDYTDGLEHYPVSHLIVHHTVSSSPATTPRSPASAPASASNQARSRTP